MIPNSFGNVIAWILTLAGSMAFVAATFGVIYFLGRLGQETRMEIPTLQNISLALHDTYISIRISKMTIWMLIFCIACSAVITSVGYIHTNLYKARILQQGYQRAKLLK